MAPFVMSVKAAKKGTLPELQIGNKPRQKASQILPYILSLFLLETACFPRPTHKIQD